jgi:hypothetical protein
VIHVVSLPQGERWWYGGAIAQDAHGDLWGPFGHLPDPGPVRAEAAGLRVAAGRVDADGLTPIDPAPSGRTFDGWDAPEGPRRAHCCAEAGGVVWWWDEGVLYRRSSGAIWPVLALASAPALAVAPDGTAVVDGRWIVRERAVPLRRPVVPDVWVRFAEGRWYATCDDTPVHIAADGAVHPVDAIPWGPGLRWRPPAEAPGPAARRDAILAGPGDGIWDLAAGERIADLPTGLVAPTADGFAVVPRGGTRITWVDPAGRVVAERPWSIGDDVVTRLAAGPVAVTAEGRAWSLAPGAILPVERPRPPRRVRPPAPVAVDEIAVVAGVTWGWRADGLLVRFTTA